MSKINLSALAGQIVVAAQKIGARVKELDGEMAKLYAKRQALESLPLTKKDYLGLVRNNIRSAGQVHQRFLEIDFSNVDCTVYAAKRQDLAVDLFTAGRALRPESVTQLALCFFFEDLLVEGVAKALDCCEWPSGEGVSLAEIQQGIAQTQAEIDALQNERDELIAALKSYRISE